MKQTLLSAVVTLLFLATPGESTAQVRQVALPEMVSSSGMIFAGHVLHVEGKTDERGDIVTETTFRVETPIRGVLPGTLTITQYGGTSSEGTMLLAHMRYFREGERVLVLLYPPSELGFTAPIGMGQGVWNVNDAGEISGLGDHLFEGLRGVMQGAKVAGPKEGRMALSGMIDLIRTLALGGGGK